MTNVIIQINNQAGASSGLADPFISVVGTFNGVAQNFNIASNGSCTPVSQNQGGSTCIQLSALSNSAISIDASITIISGRIYFCSQAGAITVSGVDAVTADFYYDWVEFALNSGSSNQLVVNTTQVDQFGFPIVLDVQPPDVNFGPTAGVFATRSSVITAFQGIQPLAYQDCLFPVGSSASDFYRILSPNLAIVKLPSSTLTSIFTQAIDDFFTFYTENVLYLNSDSAYPYAGNVMVVSELGIDNQMHDYTVIQFNFASNAPVNPGIPIPPSSGTGPYNLYYPFFTTNNPQGHASFNGQPILPPPSWWQQSLPAGNLNDLESPSQMVFAGNGIFADTFWQLDIASTSPSPQAMVLGNLENQINVAFNRGHANTWFTLCGNLSPSVETAPPYTSTIVLSGDFTQQNEPNTTANLIVGMQVISFGAGIPLTITQITGATTFEVSSPQPILAQNAQYLTFANFYASGAIWNAYGQFFHQTNISIGGRAYALSFDDQGGFSSTLTSNWGSDDPSQLTITLGEW